MPACPVSASTTASAGREAVRSPQIRSGRMGTSPLVSTVRYFSRQALLIRATSSIQPSRSCRGRVPARAIILRSTCRTSPSTAARSG
ncbi:hypothetical protein [Actinomadura madurae]|uniref:hypothetical protein n=1 Tax=Actinomadura madurae TaxID=1993 RepID=UPI0020D25979|nr:hypothetical protein [Actinomadura madurae]MCQ0006623.1 hypothetical protein [Actinomadura madurae]